MKKTFNFSVIICTYARHQVLNNLIKSITCQNIIPNQILIIDSSDEVLSNLNPFKLNKTIMYQWVGKESRALTKQRNIGIGLVDKNSEFICFLDDDVILENDYFEQLLQSFEMSSKIIGVGGYITNAIEWIEISDKFPPDELNYFHFDNWLRKMPLRFKIRSLLGLEPNANPGFMPKYGHGYSVSFLPPSGKVYETEMIMGGVSAFRKSLFSTIKFSEYFEGYGLYEDADFSLRASKHGKLVVNTAARLSHHHAPQGRPNHFKYGQMVVRNGYYVWRVKNPNPVLRDRFRWHAITILLWTIRATNIITGPNRSGALLETLGRKIGWLSLWFSPLILDRND